MIYERIYFVTERISDILSRDQERKETLNLYSNGEIKKILKIYMELEDSEREKIEEMYEQYSDDKRNKLLLKHKMYEKEIEEMYEAKDFQFRTKLHDLPRLYKAKELYRCMSDDIRKKILVNNKIFEKEIEEMYEQPSDDERKKFLEVQNTFKKNTDAEVKKFLEILKMYELPDPMDTSISNSDLWKKRFHSIKIHFLKLCERVFQLNPLHSFCELFSFIMDHKEEESIFLSDDVREKLQWVLERLKHIEATRDEQELKQDCNRFYWELSNIANKSDQILDHVFNKQAVASSIHSLRLLE